jgi:hypothetical protein
MATLGADIKVISQVGVIQYRLTGSAFAPQSFWYDLLVAAFFALNLWGEEFLEPAHKSF